ncbi:MAG: sec-independent protein translocase protein TatA, partial [Sediminicola sp.]
TLDIKLSSPKYICAMISQVFFLFISGAEIGFILFVVLLVFGADKVPEISRGLAKGMRQIKDATNDIKSEITKSAEKNKIDLDITKDIKNKIEEVRDEVEDSAGSIKRKF